jgi:hypothetical protein
MDIPFSSLVWRRRNVLFWAVLALGVLFQAFGPHLKIKKNKFVLPPSLVSSSQEIRPVEIVTRERRLQIVSGVLTLAGALGLTLCYREALFGRCSARPDPAGRSDEESTSIRSAK